MVEKGGQLRAAAIIQARMGSTRLPEKVLMPVLGKPLLAWMLDRVSLSKTIDEIIVATSTDDCDDVIEDFVVSYGYKVFRGSQNDVLDRYYQAAKSLSIKPDIIIRLTGDCPALDPSIVDLLVSEYDIQKLDFISNTEPLPSTWPDGMDVAIMSFKALKKAWQIAKKPSEREHVTFIFYNEEQIFKSKRVECSTDLSNYRLTIDYPEDFEVLENLITHFSENTEKGFSKTSMNEIIKFLNQNIELIKMNNMYVRGQGWEPSFEEDSRVKKES